MKRIYKAGQLFEAAQLKAMLEAMHIPAFLRNENMMRVAGEVPFDQCWPEVWIVHDEDETLARKVLDEFRHPWRHRGPPWFCPNCGEHHEGQFSQCWKCQAERPERAPAP